MSTLKDVARLADVNISTVSRYLAGKLKVTGETELRIQDAIKRTGYKPNLIAQTLRSGSSNIIGVIAPDIYQSGISGIVYGIDECVNDSQYALTVLMTKGVARRELEALELLRNMMASGVIVIGHPLDENNTNQDLIETLGAHIPLVLVSRNFKASNIPEVCPDQVSGAALLTHHLLKRGCRKIGVIVSRKEHPDAREKIDGHRRSLAQHGLKGNNEWIVEGYYDPETTRQATGRLLQLGVDAILCTTNEMAIYSLLHLQENGIAVPGQVAVAGYGGTHWSQIYTPRLTNVAVPVEDMGKTAAQTLLRVIAGDTRPERLAVLPVQLQVGETT